MLRYIILIQDAAQIEIKVTVKAVADRVVTILLLSHCPDVLNLTLFEKQVQNAAVEIFNTSRAVGNLLIYYIILLPQPPCLL